jgi:spermidine synthase
MQPGRALALLIAAASGAAMMVHEVVWLRALTLPFSGTQTALGLGLAVFVLGIAFGAYWGGRAVDAGRSPWRLVFCAELVAAGLAIATLGFCVVFGAVGFWGGLVVLTTVFVQAAASGLTFPVLARVTHPGGGAGAHLPGLYATHALGGTAGALAAGLWLPYIFGLWGAVAVGVALNLAAAGAMALGFRRVEARLESHSEAPSAGRLLLGLAFGSGVLTLAAEVFWTRQLTIQWNDQYFLLPKASPAEIAAVLLAMVTAGNGLGALIAVVTRQWSLRRATGLLISLYLALSLVCLAALEWVGVSAAQAVEGLHLRVALFLPPVLVAVLIGTSFPLLARLYGGQPAGHGGRVGRIWGFNALGGLLGALLATSIGLGGVGSGWGMIGCAVLALSLALVVLQLTQRRSMLTPVAFVVGLVAVIAAVGVPKAPGQVFRLADADLRGAWEGRETTTFVVAEGLSSAPGFEGEERLVLHINGHSVRSDDEHWQPLDVLHDLAVGRKRVLLVGLSTGKVAAALLAEPSIERLEVVEIDRHLLESLALFGTESILDDTRLKLVWGDGFRHLGRTPSQWDLIVVAAWNPVFSPTLYSAEFHERARDALAPKGVMWLKFVSNRVGGALGERIEDAVRCTYPATFQRDVDDTSLIAAAETDALAERGPLALTALAGPDELPCRPHAVVRPARMSSVGRWR